jgi:hypothetical protein
MEMQRLVRFARYWDLVANSGRFTHTLELILDEHPFEHFMQFSDWIYAKTDATHKIALDRLANLVQTWLELNNRNPEQIKAATEKDYAWQAHKLHIKPKKETSENNASTLPQRQIRHLT